MKRAAASARQNVFYSVLEYVSQPAMMILAAPVLLRALGTEQYGAWMLINSIAATAGGLGGGFGDGATKYISMYRGLDDRIGAVRSLAAVLVIECSSGLLSAALMLIVAPLLIGHFFPVEISLRHAAIVAVRISAFVLVLRFAETVLAAAVRGCERYRPVVMISVAARASSVVAAVVLALNGSGLVAILWANLAIGILSFAGQGWLAHTVLEASGVWRHIDLRAGIREVFRFGAYTWLKSTLGVALAHGDRLMVAALLGTGPLAFYALCNQLTQPIHAIVASGFSFLFPNLSARSAAGRWPQVEAIYRRAALVSGVIVAVIACGMALTSHLILRLWLGGGYAQQYHTLLLTMIVGNGLLALSVVPHYAALAVGRSQALAAVTFTAGVISLGCGYLLIRQFGLIGGGLAKVVAGIVFLSLFAVVRHALRHAPSNQTLSEHPIVPAVV